MEAVIIIVILGAGSGFFFYKMNEAAMRRHVVEVMARWTSENRAVHVPPVQAAYYNLDLGQYYTAGSPLRGALGLVDETIEYVGRGYNFSFAIPLDMIRWIGTHNITVKRGKSTAGVEVLSIHYETQSWGQMQWCVATFKLTGYAYILRDLAEHTGLKPRHLSGSDRPDCGPLSARRMTQDIYGQWHEEQTGKLYLAPDRILFHGRDPIPFAQVQRIEVYERGGLLNDVIPLVEELLRIEYTGADGQHQVIGFLTRGADKAGKMLHESTRAPFRQIEGRKKK